MALLDANNNVVQKQWIAASNPKGWMPDVVTTEAFSVTFPSAPIGCKLAIGLFLNPSDVNPTYRLGIQGRVNNGWYVLAGTPNVAPATWDHADGGSWQTPANWTGNNTHSGIDVIANFANAALTRDATVTLDGAVTAGSLLFDAATPIHNWTVNTGTGGSLTLTVSPGAPAPSITVNNQTLTMKANLNGHRGLVKGGSGRLVLAGTNRFLGNTVINGGVLEIASNSKLYSVWQAASVTVNAGATLRINGWGGYSDGGMGELDQIPADNPNVLLLNGGALEFTGAPGTRSNSNRAIGLGTCGGTLKNSSSASWTIAASGTGRQATVADNSSLTLAGAGLHSQLQKAIVGAGSLTKADSGTWTLGGSNNYTGMTKVSGGKLVLSGTIAGTSSVTVATGAEVDVTGKLYATGNIVNSGTLVLGGSAQFAAGGKIINNGTIVNNSPALSLPAIVNHGTITGAATKPGNSTAAHP